MVQAFKSVLLPYMQNGSVLQFSYSSLKRYAQHNKDICTPDRRDILHLIILILVPNVMKGFQTILVLKGSTGAGFF